MAGHQVGIRIDFKAPAAKTPFQELNKELDKSQKQVAKLNALLGNADLLKKRVDLTIEEKAARQKVTAAVEAQRQALDEARSEEEKAAARRTDIFKAINKELESSRFQIEKANAILADTDLLQERVRLTLEEEEARKNITDAVEAERQAREAAREAAKSPGQKLAERQADIYKSLHAELEGSARQVEKINALLADTGLLKERVRLTLEEEAARKKLADLLEAERQAQIPAKTPQQEAAERRAEILKSITDELDAQIKKQERINELLKDPALLNRLAHQQAAAEHAAKLFKAQLENEKDRLLGREAPEVQRAGPAPKAEKIPAVQRASAADLLRNPRLLRAQVAKEIRDEETNRRLSAAKEAERARQLGQPLGGQFTRSSLKKILGGKLSALGVPVGPIAAGTAAAAAMIPVIKRLAEAPFKAVTAGLAGVNAALREMGGALGPIGAFLALAEKAGDAFASLGDKMMKLGLVGGGIAGGVIGAALGGPIGAAIGAAVGALVAAIPGMVAKIFGETFKELAKQARVFLELTVGLAAKAQPGVVKRFGLAVDDSAAVIGHRMVPVVELMTKVVRGIGDVLHTILPSTRDFRDALSPLGDAFKDIKQALADLAPVIKTVLQVGLKVFKAFMQEFANFVHRVVDIGRQLGLLTGKGQLMSSVGLAARPAHFTSPEEYAKSIYQAAFSQGHDPQETTADNTTKMAQALSSIDDFLKRTFGEKAAAVLGSNQGVAGVGMDIFGFGRSLLTGGLPGAAAFGAGIYGRVQSAPDVNPNESAAGGGGDTMSRTESLLERIHDALTMGAGGPVGALAGAARRTWLGLGGG